MEVHNKKILDFLHNSKQLRIPIYQRNYSWEEFQYKKFLEDTLESGKKENSSSHFIGSVISIGKGLATSSFSSFLVIDGQQRITTMTLLLEALSRVLGDEEPMEGCSSEKIRGYYLLNEKEKEEKKYKLILKETDKDSLIHILSQRKTQDEENFSYKIQNCFHFFLKEIQKVKEKGNVPELWLGMNKLFLVDITLEKGKDNPQLIFESMNSTGKDLTQAELIQNFILMGISEEEQNFLYQDYWRPMEKHFGQENYNNYFDTFMRYYLSMKEEKMIKIGEVYETFKKFFYQRNFSHEQIVKDIFNFSQYYCAISLGKEKNKDLFKSFKELKSLETEIITPFLLQLYDDYKKEILSLEDFLEILEILESYLFRRAVCGIPSNSLNKLFPSLGKDLNKQDYLNSFKYFTLSLKGTNRFPSEEEFKGTIQIRDLYNFKKKTYLLSQLENFQRKEIVSLNGYTIEHILPQNPNLSREWKESLGENWKSIQEKWVHTLGNLTLTRYNSELGASSFEKKKTIEGGFNMSPLRLNQNLKNLDQWNENSILQRAEELSQKALQVWKDPCLDKKVFNQYQEQYNSKKSEKKIKKEEKDLEKTSYFKFIKKEGITQNLFNLLRQEILSLEENITEEYLSYYIAYKYDRNFVDLVPQSKNMAIFINMKFHELEDERDLKKDISQVGHHANGDIRIDLEKEEDIPYIIGLIRQSLEKQM